MYMIGVFTIIWHNRLGDVIGLLCGGREGKQVLYGTKGS